MFNYIKISNEFHLHHHEIPQLSQCLYAQMLNFRSQPEPQERKYQSWHQISNGLERQLRRKCTEYI